MTQVFTPSASEIKRCLPLLEPDEFSRLGRGFLGLKTPEQAAAISLLDQLQMGVWEWLVMLGFVTDAQREYLLTTMRPALEPYARWLGSRFQDGLLQKSELPRFSLTLLDLRYAHWSGHAALLDIQDRACVDILNEPAITHMTCDVTAMYCRLYDRLVRVRRSTDAVRRQSDPGSAAREQDQADRA